MVVEQVRFRADPQFWPSAVAAVLRFGDVHAVPARQMQGLTWLVPNGGLAGVARSAWSESFADVAHVPPRIAPLADWLGVPLRSGTAAHMELFDALRANRWIREAFGAQPSTLWGLARGIAELCDELTWAAAEGAVDFDARLNASLVRHFRHKAARALQPQAQLVLRLWRARHSADDGPARALRELAARADAATVPLVYLIDPARCGGDSLLTRWEQGFVERYARRAPVLVIEPESKSVVAGTPLLAAAWPELAGASAEIPIAARSDALRAASPPDAGIALTLVEAASLESEATAVARQVQDWIAGGVGSVGLVALDRLTARRVRALLERAQVLIRDETGWKLSTTSAAATVMRWFDLVANRLYWRDLLDWLRSPFTLADRPGKAREIATIERAIRAGSVVQGADAIDRAILDLGRTGAVDETRSARDVVALLRAQIDAMRRAAPTPGAQAGALRSALAALGVERGLNDDPVGAAVMRELCVLQAELAAAGGRMTSADFRALLAQRFEDIAFIDRTIDSPITLVSLAGSTLRRFDAVLLIGADARHLPAQRSDRLFVSDAVRAELGLTTAESARRQQAAQLAMLLAATPTVVATWRNRIGDEANALSPLLQRLSLVIERATGATAIRQPKRDEFAVKAVRALRPAPRAPHLVPPRLTASRAQSLVDCAYQFYARQLLRLTEIEDVTELPGKRDFGTLLHETLRRFHVEWGDAPFDTIVRDRLMQNLIGHAHAVFEPEMLRTPGLLAYQRRFEGVVPAYVDWLQEHAAKGWRWRAAEEAATLSLPLSDREIELAGRIDRADAHADGRRLLIDYKARPAGRLRDGLKEPGEDIQLPFYGVLMGEATEAAYISFDRSRESRGIEPIAPSQPFDWLVTETRARLQVDLQRIVDGAPLPAIGAEPTCTFCEMRGLCRRDYWEYASDDAESGEPDAAASEGQGAR